MHIFWAAYRVAIKELAKAQLDKKTGSASLGFNVELMYGEYTAMCAGEGYFLRMRRDGAGDDESQTSCKRRTADLVDHEATNGG